MIPFWSTPAARRWAGLGGALFVAQLALAQDPFPESGVQGPPLDDYVERTIVRERPVLAYAPIREADILWEKRIWRVIDTREKLNLPFVAPQAPLFRLLIDGAMAGRFTLYSTEDDQFTKTLTNEQLHDMLVRRDSIYTIDVETGIEQLQVVENEINWENVKRFRIKEAWFFDTRTSQLRVRILGLAPLIEQTDEEGNFRAELPLFWVHYPSARPAFARWKAAVHADNAATTTTWEDLFERRQFASHIYKENNLHDRRLQDYLAGTDLLLEGQKINDALFNREMDAWQW
jgi:gliding motility associated protien GldN